MRLKSIVVCDDVRQEIGNKLTLVGAYNEAIVFPAGEGGLGLPKLAVVFVVSGLRGVAQIDYRHFLHFGDGPLLEPTMTPIQRPPAQDEQNFVLLESPLVLPGPGRLRAVLDVRVEGETERYEYAFEVRRLAPSTAH